MLWKEYEIGVFLGVVIGTVQGSVFKNSTIVCLHPHSLTKTTIMKLKSLLQIFTLAVVFMSSQLVMAQGVTTSSMSGTVTDTKGQPLVGANVVATHQPSGTVYGAASDANGNYRIPAMRVGGPYEVKVTFIGFSTRTVENLFLRLGENERRNFELVETGGQLGDVVVTATASSIGQTSGTSTQVSRSQIENLPTLNQDLRDFARLTPQASLYGEGITFAGMNNRFNAIYIDGAVNNDVFGLASSGTNGGQTGIQPFAIDIIDQLQVVLSPYDVTLGGFAGGGINAVTKSGTNTFTGSAYSYLQNENLVGKTNGVLANRLNADRTRVDPFVKRTFGASVGGPIKKDKAFFFANVEVQRDENPQPFEFGQWSATPGRSTETKLNDLRNFLINQYGYDPGTFTSTKDELNGLKIFAKVDYNLNANNYLTVRHQYSNGENINRNAGSANTINFSNNGIFFPSTTNSSAIELNSVFGTRASNNLILSYVDVKDDRGSIGSNFPYVIINDVSSGQIRFGTEEFSTGNLLTQKIFSLTNNFRLYQGKHTLTFGTHNEFYDLYNVFLPQNFGSYRFANVDAFLNGLPAISYNRSYSLVDDITGDGTAAAADFKAAQFGFYAQDEWNVNSKFTMTYGLRIDIPIIMDDPKEDTYFNSVALPKMQRFYASSVLQGNPYAAYAKDARAGKAPDGQIMFSPRIGFNYDASGESQLVFRGGLGVFTSRIPFVWPGAMFNNNGLTQGQVNQANAGVPILFRPDINNQYTNPNFRIPSGQVDLFTSNFKYPQVFRTNFAVDAELPFGILSTFEGLFTKTINNIMYTNINANPTAIRSWTGGPDTRPVYSTTVIDNTYTAVYLASNTSKGYSYNLSASFAKSIGRALNVNAAYSYNDAYALSEGTSSQNSSQWRGQVNIRGRNFAEYGRADFAAGHRVITSASYRYDWTRDGNNATTISLFMNAQSGQPYSYVIGGNLGQNLNSEPGSTNANRSLVYIPNSRNDINLVNYTAGGVTVTAAQQWERLNRLIEDDKYLSKNRGRYAEKNAAWAPFETQFDVSLRHDLGLNVNGQRQRIQLMADVQNFANLLNNEWGARYFVPGNFNNYYLYQFEGYEANGTTPRFTFRSDAVGLERYNVSGTSSRWRMRFGVKYMFN
jgi:hypothetical protein